MKHVIIGLIGILFLSCSNTTIFEGAYYITLGNETLSDIARRCAEYTESSAVIWAANGKPEGFVEYIPARGTRLWVPRKHCCINGQLRCAGGEVI